MTDAAVLVFVAWSYCAAALVAVEIYKRGVKKGVSLALSEIQSMHATIDLLVVDGKGSLELNFTKQAKEKVK